MTVVREELARTLVRRSPTGVVARFIVALRVPGLPRDLERQLQALSSAGAWYMADDFDAVLPATRRLERFRDLFPELRTLAAEADGLDPVALRALVAAGMAYLDLPDRTPEDVLIARTALRGSVRKRVRFLRRLAEKADRIEDGWRYRHALMQAKSRLAYAVNWERCDDLTLAFCAYLAARANRRSLFLFGSQSRAKDEVVEGLYELLEANPGTDWPSVALVYPVRDVIARLSPEERGALIARFHSQMAVAARELGRLWPTLPERMRAEMVMVKGIDSSRWNAYAGALNTMRSAWINAVLAANLDEVLDGYLPGKAPRLIAADVAWMHRDRGGELHEDTRVFALLRRPWEVVNGEATQGRADVLRAARAAKVDAEGTGWVGPRTPEKAERPEPEPALVHGVVVTDPEFARSLRRCGVFSGKRLRHLDELLDLPALERPVFVRDDGAVIPAAAPAPAEVPVR